MNGADRRQLAVVALVCLVSVASAAAAGFLSAHQEVPLWLTVLVANAANALILIATRRDRDQ